MWHLEATDRNTCKRCKIKPTNQTRVKCIKISWRTNDDLVNVCQYVTLLVCYLFHSSALHCYTWHSKHCWERERQLKETKGETHLEHSWLIWLCVLRQKKTGQFSDLQSCATPNIFLTLNQLAKRGPSGPFLLAPAPQQTVPTSILY